MKLKQTNNMIIDPVYNICFQQSFNKSLILKRSIHRMQRFTQQKDQGNQQFKNKNYPKALQIFTSTIKEIQKIDTKEYLVPTSELSKLYVILLINSAFACINIKTKQSYQQAIELTTKALSVDSKNVKALFRRGVATKEMAEVLERQNGSTYKGLIQLYTKSKQDFQQVNLLQKSNDLAMQKFKQTVKDIYRVTKAQGEQINLTNNDKSSKTQPTQKQIQQKIAKSTPYESQTRKRGVDMQKIMQQYRVNEVSDMVQKKVQESYLNGPLPQTRSQLQKGIREIRKSSHVFCELIYRFDDSYLTKVNPTFDMLSEMIAVVLKQGKQQRGKNALLTLRNCKSFNLYWKSLVKRQKQDFTKKWVEFGLQTSKLE